MDVLLVYIEHNETNIHSVHHQPNHMELKSKLVESIVQKLLEIFALKDVKLLRLNAIFHNVNSFVLQNLMPIIVLHVLSKHGKHVNHILHFIYFTRF